MKLKWQQYWYDMGAATLKNVGTVGTSWMTMNGLNNVGVNVPKMNMESLAWLLGVAGVLGAVFAYWTKTPLPEVDTTTVTVTTTKTKDEPSNPPTPGNTGSDRHD